MPRLPHCAERMMGEVAIAALAMRRPEGAYICKPFVSGYNCFVLQTRAA